MYCPKCKADVDPVYNTRVCSNGAKHVEARCFVCSRFLKNITQNNNPRLPFGVYEGKYIDKVPLDYLKWLLETGVKNKGLKQAIEKVLYN